MGRAETLSLLCWRKRNEQITEIRVPLAAVVLLCFLSAGAALGAGTLFFGWKTGAVQVKLREIDRLAADKYTAR